jgi:hypothetical protein
LKTTKTLTKRPRRKLEIKRRRPKLKNIIYAKLELRTNLKIKKISQKNQEKKLEIKAIRTSYWN